MIAFTFRNEYQHLNWDYGQDPYVEYERYLNMGLDGYFTDFPGSLNNYFEGKMAEHLLETVPIKVLYVPTYII